MATTIRGAVVVVVAGGALVGGAEVGGALVGGAEVGGAELVGPEVVLVVELLLPPPPPPVPTQSAPFSTQPTWLSMMSSDPCETYCSPLMHATATVATMSAYSGRAAPRSRVRSNQLVNLVITAVS